MPYGEILEPHFREIKWALDVRSFTNSVKSNEHFLSRMYSYWVPRNDFL